MTRCLHRLAEHYCQGRLFLALEGGYNPDMIAQCTVECLRSLVAEAHGVSESGNWTGLIPPAMSPPPSVPGTPACMSPAPSPCISSDAEVTPTSTPRMVPSSRVPGNSVLHFAAGYGRKAVCDVLRLHLGPSDAHRINALGQTAADVARVNRHDVAVLLGDLQPSSS
ncbi:unnamed protein product [Polarella glacialis]|uniref:Histone deacetylase n=1 Tax=Polarella glacialis TaxID=89957 RepID=A0A813FR59_POLGL|nr:unnamed protein product [Polarella glacialis]